MGRRLRARGLAPDLFVSSPAVRALATARLFAEAVDYPVEEIREDERIYLASPAELLEVIHDLDESVGQVVLFGHNPGLTDLVNALSAPAIDNVPTCGVAELRIETGRWADVSRDTVRRVDFDYPKRGRR